MIQHRQRFRVRGDAIECWPAYEEFAYRIELWGDEIEKLSMIDPVSGKESQSLREIYISGKAPCVTAESNRCGTR